MYFLVNGSFEVLTFRLPLVCISSNIGSLPILEAFRLSQVVSIVWNSSCTGQGRRTSRIVGSGVVPAEAEARKEHE